MRNNQVYFTKFWQSQIDLWEIQDYNFELIYKPGIAIKKANILSRQSD